MPLGTRNWGGTEYHDSIFDPESQPQEYEQPYVEYLQKEKKITFAFTVCLVKRKYFTLIGPSYII